jgi:hypothetical protein
MPLIIHHYIIRFKVSINDIVAVEHLKGYYNLSGIEFNPVFIGFACFIRIT